MIEEKKNKQTNNDQFLEQYVYDHDLFEIYIVVFNPPNFFDNYRRNVPSNEKKNLY
jgi:hypothetical protein